MGEVVPLKRNTQQEQEREDELEAVCDLLRKRGVVEARLSLLYADGVIERVSLDTSAQQQREVLPAFLMRHL
jgi:hypothetical protein